ncbi:MAG: hypothetical protein OER88_06405, partial [Planctomycetota bacterium]|nr:hypothetical protein [Planctomycetota bacterium]
KLGDGALKKVLDRIETRQIGPLVVQIYDVKDFQIDPKWWAFAVGRVRAVTRVGTVTASEERGTLIVQAPSIIHDRIQADLKSMRAKLSLMVMIEVRMVKTGKPGVPVKRVTDKTLERFLREVEGTVVTAPRLTTRNGGSANVSVVTQRSYVSDFDIELEKNGVIADPTIATVSDGVRVDLRASVDENGKSVHVAIDARISETDKEMPRMKLALPIGKSVEIQIPQGRSRGVTRLVRCEPGTHTVVRVDPTLVILVKAEPVKMDRELMRKIRGAEGDRRGESEGKDDGE